jgi:NAD-dependent dihydropyrimidine dehydrogenase PreA subunit
MKTAIIVFSPSGHTLKVAEMMEQSMTDKGMQVQLLDITRNKRIFRENRMEQYLEEKVEPHDLVCVGGPVYAGHFEGNAMNTIKALPDPDKTWGKLAIPFISYGGLHSSIALMEAGNLFHESGRKNISGMKIASFHTLSTALSFKINENKPGAEALPVIEELVERIAGIVNQDFAQKDIRKSFSYAPTIERLVLRTLSQEFWHGKYKPVEIDYNKCNGCGICVAGCPVNMFEMVDGKPQRTRATEHCILCAECFHNCPVGAISYKYLSKAKKRLETLSKKMEFPQSAVYPLQNTHK